MLGDIGDLPGEHTVWSVLPIRGWVRLPFGHADQGSPEHAP